jgi:hypothetical protein
MIDRGARKNVMGGVEEVWEGTNMKARTHTFEISGCCPTFRCMCMCVSVQISSSIPVRHSIPESTPYRVLKIKIKIIVDANKPSHSEVSSSRRIGKGALDSVAW